VPAADREILLKIPAFSDEVFFAEMSGRDEISHPFRYELLFACANLDLKALDVLGQPVIIEVTGDSPRFFHGLATAFGLHEIRDDYAYYRLTMSPWLWFLSMKTDNRIFQEKTVPQIIEEVFGAYPAKFDSRLKGSYKPRDYCVQYGESDLDFVHRLMEHEGIFYFFEHESDGHRMILADRNSAMKPAPGAETLPYEPDSRISFKEGDFITHWLPLAQVTPGAFAQTDYDFEKPSSDLMSKAKDPAGHDGDAGENYEYPGHYVDHGRGDELATVRLEALQAPFTRIEARGTARPLWSGRTFKLDLFPREAENAEYIVLRVDYRLWDDQLRSGQFERLPLEFREMRLMALDQARERPISGYEVQTGLQPLETPYRPERRTKHPVMRGPQTAVVVGPAGAEIFTDKYSRVKVQFFWDRQGRKNENTTCFIRVSSVWAGSGWGFIQIPRIGQEVIVDFLDGDPDQPIITGRVYNAEQMPPYKLPGNETQSGWKSNSSPGGGGWNELRFEDKKGSEEVYFQAEKDHNELVKNNESRRIGNDFAEDVGHDAQQSIGNDRTESVGHDKSVTVGNNRSVSIGVNDDETVGANRSLTVGANETISIGSNSTETIGANHSQTVAIAQAITVGAARVDSVGASETRSVGGPQDNTIGASRSVTVGASQSHSIGSDDSVQIGGSQGTQIGGDQSISVGGGLTLSVGKDNGNTVSGGRKSTIGKDELLEVGGKMGVAVGKTLTVEVKDEITLKCGSAQIVMKKDGTIAIEGKDINVKGSGKINFKADSDINAKGSKINLN
jgi:type VI secretion system secreted protein VgrG